mmetsp:Transcript_27865/g.81537  ORF Transcript_27865/g.81537 Transcript_27865/m.81537 type:complete len:451 (+) Transcript_27865:40-1392(+)
MSFATTLTKHSTPQLIQDILCDVSAAQAMSHLTRHRLARARRRAPREREHFAALTARHPPLESVHYRLPRVVPREHGVPAQHRQVARLVRRVALRALLAGRLVVGLQPKDARPHAREVAPQLVPGGVGKAVEELRQPRYVGLLQAKREVGPWEQLLERLVDRRARVGIVLDHQRHASLRDALVAARAEAHPRRREAELGRLEHLEVFLRVEALVRPKLGVAAQIAQEEARALVVRAEDALPHAHRVARRVEADGADKGEQILVRARRDRLDVRADAEGARCDQLVHLQHGRDHHVLPWQVYVRPLPAPLRDKRRLGQVAHRAADECRTLVVGHHHHVIGASGAIIVGPRLADVRHHPAQKGGAAAREPVEPKFIVVEALRQIGGHEKVVRLGRVERAVWRAQQPAVHLRVERVEVRLIPPSRHTEVRRQPDVELGWQVVHIDAELCRGRW